MKGKAVSHCSMLLGFQSDAYFHMEHQEEKKVI
jgi:hypothetical protein